MSTQAYPDDATAFGRPRVTISDDGINIVWGGLLISIDEDGIGYALKKGDRYEPGRHEMSDRQGFADAVHEMVAHLQELELK